MEVLWVCTCSCFGAVDFWSTQYVSLVIFSTKFVAAKDAGCLSFAHLNLCAHPQDACFSHAELHFDRSVTTLKPFPKRQSGRCVRFVRIVSDVQRRKGLQSALGARSTALSLDSLLSIGCLFLNTKRAEITSRGSVMNV